MFKKTLPAGVIFILLLAALVTMGIAYGAWTQQLNINGTANTGTFDVVFYYPFFDEVDPAGVGDCQMARLDDGHTIQVTITNGYPGYLCEGGATYQNLGTVPAEIVSVQQITNNVPWTGVFSTTPPTDGVINPAEIDSGGFWVNFQVPEDAQEGQTYTFSYRIVAEQYTP
jgi:hypothetical protein